MTRTVVSVGAFTPFKEIVRRMQEHRVSAVPVVDEDGRILGIVSEGDLILKEDPGLEGEPHFLEGISRREDRSKAAGLVASEVMSAPVFTLTPDDALGEAARIMHRKAIKRLPVVDPATRVILGIVSRADLLTVFLRDDAEIAAEINEGVIRRSGFDPDAIRVVVRDGIVVADGQLERRDLIPVFGRLVLGVEGVVALENRLTSQADDIPPPSDLQLRWSPLVPEAVR